MSLSVRKLHVITQTLPGMYVDDALTQLQFMASPWAKEVAKVVRSAAANAENNYDLDPSMLAHRAHGYWAGGDAAALQASGTWAGRQAFSQA